MVFVDTSGWFALFVPTDPHHARVHAWFRAHREPLITTDYCVDETLTLLAARGELRRAMEAGRAFFEGRLAELHFLIPDQIRRAWSLYQQRAAARWSFTDCTSHVVISDRAITRAAALDDHFRQFGRVEIVP